MSKKRIAVAIVLSPFMLAIGFCMLLASGVEYALSGKWILKGLVTEWFNQKSW